VVLLQSKKQYHDWLIIISFYSALHFVRAKLFPLKENDKTFNSFDEYYIASKGIKRKHDLLFGLVITYLNQIASKYGWLLHSSETLRYSDFAVDEGEANTALLNLTAIESECSK
jgi:hypothetical protein